MTINNQGTAEVYSVIEVRKRAQRKAAIAEAMFWTRIAVVPLTVIVLLILGGVFMHNQSRRTTAFIEQHNATIGRIAIKQIAKKTHLLIAAYSVCNAHTQQSQQDTATSVMAVNFDQAVAHLDHSFLLQEWQGGRSFNRHELSKTIRSVIKNLGITTDPRVHDLLLETCAVESDLGRIVKQYHGPALSVYQILPSTYRSTLRQLRKYHPELYTKVMAYYDQTKDQQYNYTKNVPFTTAISLVYYHFATDGKLAQYVKTRQARAVLWKRVYNTSHGRGTVAGYLSKANRHL